MAWSMMSLRTPWKYCESSLKTELCLLRSNSRDEDAAEKLSKRNNQAKQPSETTERNNPGKQSRETIWGNKGDDLSLILTLEYDRHHHIQRYPHQARRHDPAL